MPDISQKQIGPLEYEVKVIFSRAEVDLETNRYCDEIKNHVQVDGFRKGNAPIQIIKQKFAEPIKTEVSTRIINGETEKAIKQTGLKITGSPSLLEQYRSTKSRKWLGEFKLDGGFGYGVSLEVEPEVVFADYAGLTVKVDLPKPEDWIATRLLELQDQFAERTQLTRPAQIGDEIVVDFASSLDGVLLPEGAESFRTMRLGQGELLKEFDEKIVGHSPEEDFEFSIQFPTEYSVPLVAGQKIDFKVRLHTVVEVKPHPLDDDLAQKAVYENLAQMKTELAEKAQADFEKPRTAKALEAIFKEILAKQDFSVPRCWVDNEIKVLAYKFGLQEMPNNPDELNSLRELATQSAKQSFILDRIYIQEPSIKIKEEEIQVMLEQEGRRIGKSAADFLGILKQNGNYDGFMAFAEQQKAVEFLIKNTTIQQ